MTHVSHYTWLAAPIGTSRKLPVSLTRDYGVGGNDSGGGEKDEEGKLTSERTRL